MGPLKENRTKAISANVTTAEHEVIATAAKERGVSVAEFVRTAAMVIALPDEAIPMLVQTNEMETA